MMLKIEMDFYETMIYTMRELIKIQLELLLEIKKLNENEESEK